ncbi:MAG: hypothetical protein NTNFB01_08180 [Nitrospira sp.]
MLCRRLSENTLGERLVALKENVFYHIDLVDRLQFIPKDRGWVMKPEMKRLIPICCVCENVRGENLSPGAEPEWGPLKLYLDTHRLAIGAYRLIHAYCPACAVQFAKLGRTVCPAVTEEYHETDNSVTLTILDAFDHMQQCDLDMLVEACPTLTWNQVFSEVDRLSRMGHLRLSHLGQGRYTIERPQPVAAGVGS